MQDSVFDSQKTSNSLNVRCPDCFKPYIIEVAEIREPRPRFECKSCQTRFWIAFPEALGSPSGVIGFPLDWDAQQVRETLEIEEAANFQCPKCKAPYIAGALDCKKCGVVFLKFEEQSRRAERREQEGNFSASIEVRQHWDSVLENYENREIHQNFISAAWVDKSLDYASHKYATILEIMPQDEMSLYAQKEIRALVGTRFEIVASDSKSTVSSWWENFNFFKDVDVSFRKIRWTTLIMLGCGVVIGIGMVLPHLRNMIGFGTSILFFILALRYYFRVI